MISPILIIHLNFIWSTRLSVYNELQIQMNRNHSLVVILRCGGIIFIIFGGQEFSIEWIADGLLHETSLILKKSKGLWDHLSLANRVFRA